MRELTSHRCGTLNSSVDIQVMDEPGEGNACHVYQISLSLKDNLGIFPTCINFQNGPIVENGVNGISDESLLAIVQDRLEGFAEGDFSCNDNSKAWAHVRQALECLKDRTRDRVERGVEGKSEK